jgi:hypothetical protein
MKKVCLVACVSTKLSTKSPARELYISPLFQKARSYAESRFDEWYILSAKHHLLDPDSVIAPYEKTLNNMPKQARREWSEQTYQGILSTIQNGSTLAFVAGERYREDLVKRLQEDGYTIRIPLEKLSIGIQLSWLNKIQDESERLQHLDEFYRLLRKLEQGLGGRRLMKACTGAMDWPEMGVYFFFEHGEFRTSDVVQDRVVRVGTHTVSIGSKSTLWNRLRTHRGGEDRSGNHRGSIFRLHVGAALINQSQGRLRVASWGNGQTADARTRSQEASLEETVSNHIGAMTLLWLAIGDEPSPTSDRAYIEQNAIALLAGHSGPIDLSTPRWLGKYSDKMAIKKSGLWNVNYVDDEYDPRFLQVMAFYVDVTLGKSLVPQESIAPLGWASVKRKSRNREQLSLFGEI